MTVRREWPDLVVRLRPSWSLSVWVAATHGLAVCSIACLPVPPAIGGGLLLGIVALAGVAVRRHGLRSARDSLLALEWRSDGGWRLETAGQGWTDGWRMAGSGVVHPWLVVVGFDGEAGHGRRRRYLVAVPGVADEDSLRRLRVRLGFDRRRPGR